MIRIATLLLLVNVLMAQESGCDKTKRTTMSQSAQDYIAAFKRGEDFRPPAKGVFVNGQPDDGALKVLGKELAGADPNVRENIVELLVDMGRVTDPLTPKGADVIRHAGILDLLAGPGLAKPDLGREAALEQLRKRANQSDLARYDTAFTNALAEEPTTEAFLLVAKAKSQKAKDLVDRLVKLPRWENLEAAKIARAALGSKDDEDRFLAILAAAKDGAAVEKALRPLGLIGTPRSLKVIAEHLRSPMTVEVGGSSEGINLKSVRLSVLDALQYNFPEEPSLYQNNINYDEDYRKAERFCTDRLGVVYNNPPPPFFKYGSFPQPSR
jgi:hypothetical protein